MENTATTSTNQHASSQMEGADCERVNTILDQIIVGQEPSVEDEEYFVNHAEDCSPCFDSIGKQQIFIDFLAQHVGRKGAPSALPQTILARLQAEMA
ncbi:hypothetical protein [Hymenobacter lucidus]|uniref:Zinc-finger domain-containing protein n=1 Tax=Hymenobacter lucidus TaxID=2880930 RepID=A0ABS8AN19_9BACT|nr:hypothetical protein [Hymenobacter lucidus]MCB2407043.1 hypothetical protein [Hymenobacter lucidus]